MTEKLKNDDGLEKIKLEAEEAADHLDDVTRRQEEFPEDALVNLNVEIAERRIDVIADAAQLVIDSKDIGLSEREKMKDIITNAKESRLYATIWKEAKGLLLNEHFDELDTMFETIEENFKEKEAEYNEAVEATEVE